MGAGFWISFSISFPALLLGLLMLWYMITGKPNITVGTISTTSDRGVDDDRTLGIWIRNRPIRNRLLKALGFCRHSADITLTFSIEYDDGEYAASNILGELSQGKNSDNSIALRPSETPAVCSIVKWYRKRTVILDSAKKDGIHSQLVPGNYIVQATYEIDGSSQSYSFSFQVGEQPHELKWT